MAATTTWVLSNVDYDLTDGFCHTAHWRVQRVDGDYSADAYGSQALTRPSSIITRTDLKAEDIIADVKNLLGADEVKSLEDGLVLSISEQKTPTQGAFLPSS